MKTKKIFHLVTSAVLLTCAVLSQGAQQSIDQRQIEWFRVSTLKDVREVYPKVGLEIVEKDVAEPNFTAKIGPLTQKDLQKHLEQILQKSGIRITNKFNATSANAPLSLNVTVFAKVRDDTPMPAYAVFVYTEALQPTVLGRNNAIRSFSRTWPMVPTGNGTRTLLFLTPETMVKEITEEVTNQVKNFIKDYSAANPNLGINVKSTQNLIAQKKPDHMISGTVIYVPIEGGFWGLRTEDGTKYDPVNLPEEYRNDGLRVYFQVKELENVAGIHMWGKIVEILKIEKQ
ncbi:MAG: hypothetical protein JW787_05805 [Sedimentisphaerales bacterium]|nr:hypothetical protein [Sedimentisphaerales bacterium]